MKSAAGFKAGPLLCAKARLIAVRPKPISRGPRPGATMLSTTAKMTTRKRAVETSWSNIRLGVDTPAVGKEDNMAGEADPVKES